MGGTEARPAAAAVLLILAAAGGVAGGCDRGDPAARRAALHLPPPGFVADPARGAALFRARCAGCHGVDARGTTQGPPLVDPVYRPARHADLAFHLAVRDGVRRHHWHFGDMPPVEGLSPEDVGHIVAWVRQEQRRAGIR